ncbi:MAG TPA: RNA polymerase sigma-70 factor [Rugosimonospora sp.]
MSNALEVFEEHRRLLFGVAYRILGSVVEAEDVVQEAWLRWDRAERRGVDAPKAYLVRIATRLALDQRERTRTARETYVGPWLPEPLVTGPDVADRVASDEAVSMAVLVVLETLSPLERAVFVLHEVFGFSYPETGEALGRSEQAVRQLGHRAREHVQARRPRFQPDRDVRRAATERFLHASMGGDLVALLEVLSPDVTLITDGGGKIRAPRRPISGADKVGRLFATAAERTPAGTEFRFVDMNGEPAAVATLGGTPYAVFIVDVHPRSGRIDTIHLIGNPDKLTKISVPRES